MGGTAVALLTTTGRRSGQPRSATVGCLRLDGDLVVVASNAGRDAHRAWYLDLVSERERLWAAVVAAAPVVDGYQRGTGRELPVVVLARVS